MTYKTHMIGGLQAGIAASAILNAGLYQTAAIIAFSTLGSVLPDIDQPNSKICQEDYIAKACSEILSQFTKHRRATHTIWFSIIFALIFYAITIPIKNGTAIFLALIAFVFFRLSHIKAIRATASIFTILAFYSAPFFAKYQVALPEISINPMLVAIAIFIGCIIHLIYDTFNPQGIQWLSPFSRKRFSIGKIQVTSRAEDRFAIIMLLFLILEGILYVRFNSLF